MRVRVPHLTGELVLHRPCRERVGFTGDCPVIAETPLMDEFLEKDAKDQ
jgi:hypothetical protein